MTQLAQISALVGTLLPLLIAVIQQSHWSRTVRTIIGVGASVLASVLTPTFYSDLNWTTWSTSAIFLIGATLTTYRNVWVPLGAAGWIEEKTTPKVKRRPRRT